MEKVLLQLLIELLQCSQYKKVFQGDFSRCVFLYYGLVFFFSTYYHSLFAVLWMLFVM